MPPHSRELWAESFWCWVVRPFHSLERDISGTLTQRWTAQILVPLSSQAKLLNLDKSEAKGSYKWAEHIKAGLLHAVPHSEMCPTYSLSRKAQTAKQKSQDFCSFRSALNGLQRFGRGDGVNTDSLDPARARMIRHMCCWPCGEYTAAKEQQVEVLKKWRQIGPKIVFVSFSIAWNLFRNLWKDWEDYKACCITRGKALSKPESRTLNPSGDQMFACFVFCFYWWSPLLLCTAWSRRFSQPFCFFQLTF